MTLKHDLRSLLAQAGREDLGQNAVGAVTFTDDGSTLYIHILPHPDWKRVAPGRAFVLAWGDYEGKPTLALRRALVQEARLSLRDSVEAIIRWLDRR
jgi:hypothetical protein